MPNFSSNSDHHQSSLWQLLKTLERVLLALMIIPQIIVILVKATPVTTIVNILGLVAFVALGQITPQRKLTKLIYTIVEFGLSFCLIVFGDFVLQTVPFIIIIIRNFFLWQKPYREWMTVLAFLGSIMGVTYRLFYQGLPVNVVNERIKVIWIAVLLSTGLGILFLYLLVDAGLREIEAQEQLKEANARLREYALKIEELATVQERNRIAREIHDSLGHSLTVFGIHLEGALRLLKSNPNKAEELLLEIKQLNTQTLKDVRQSITSLRCDPLQEKSLLNAIALLISEFHKSTGILPKFDHHLKSKLSQDLNLVIYRIMQESLTNIRKYAYATKVDIMVIESAQNLEITIADNGKGFTLSENTTGFGLQGMRERALALMGKLEIITAPNQGCRIIATLPLSKWINYDSLITG